MQYKINTLFYLFHLALGAPYHLLPLVNVGRGIKVASREKSVSIFIALYFRPSYLHVIFPSRTFL